MHRSTIAFVIFSVFSLVLAVGSNAQAAVALLDGGVSGDGAAPLPDALNGGDGPANGDAVSTAPSTVPVPAPAPIAAPAPVPASAVPASPAAVEELEAAGDEEAGGAAVKKITAGKGRIEGVVVDAKSGEPLIEAQVTVLPLGRRVLTDVDGHYSVDVKPGTYDLRVFAELLRPRRFTGIRVDSGKPTKFDLTLGVESEERIAVQEVVVVARPDVSTDAVQLVRRQKSSSVSDAISAEQIARTPDTSASEAVKRVVGATIQDNRYVVIRGLGGRYSLALLNGVPLPSPDPDLPSAPLDLFPAALLANLTVAKTFTPDLPGNFAGGALMVETRDYPSHFTLKLRLSSAVDSQATFRQVNTYEGGATDFLGYDDGSRGLPGAVPRDRPAKESLFTPEERAEMGRSFSNRWAVWKHGAAPSIGVGATVGDSVVVAGRRLGYLATANYGNRWTRQRAHLTGLGARNADGSYAPLELQLDIDTGTETSAVGALVNVGYMLAPTHRLGLIALYTHSTEDSAAEVTGTENNSNIVDRLRFRFLERRMQFTQLNGEHAFGSKLIWNWQAHLAFTVQNEPDTRDLLRLTPPGGDGIFRIGAGVGTAERTFGELHEMTAGAGTDFTVPLNSVRLKAGGAVTVAPRESRVRRFHFEVSDPAVQALPSDAAFAAQNFGSAVGFREETTPVDAFDATRYVYSGYLMADVVRFEPVRLIAGARYETAITDLTLGNSLGVNPANVQNISRTDNAILPSASVVYALSQRSNVRVAYGGTVARPHLRELSPAPYFDYVRRRVTSGNPDLEQTFIHNLDLRWETFLTGSEVLAVSTFYKYFDKPIERTAEPAGDGQNITFRNANSAKELGVEVEARANGSRLHPRLEPFYVGANFSYVVSRVDQEGASRPLQGQSPYVVNGELGFRRDKTQLSLLYNVFGRRISEVGTAGNSDLYEEAFHRLDVAWNQKLGAGLNLKVSATNLLNQPVSFRQGAGGDTRGVEIYRYLPGVTGLAVLEWSYDRPEK